MYKHLIISASILAALSLAGCASKSVPVATAQPVHQPTTLHLAGVSPGQLVEVQKAEVIGVAPAVLVGRGGNADVQIVTLEFDNGSARAVVQPMRPVFEAGEKVEIIALENGDYPSIEPLPNLPHPDSSAKDRVNGGRDK